MRLDLRLILAALLLPMTVVQANPASDYAYAFALQTDNTSEAYRVVLTPEVYASSLPSAGLRDLVVVNAAGNVVSFAPMSPSAPASHPYKLTAKLLPLPTGNGDGAGVVRVQRNANGDVVINQPHTAAPAAKPTQWLIDARRAMSIDSIEIDPLAGEPDLQLRVSVDASDDLQQWDERADDVTLVSVKRGEDAVEQRHINVGGAPARYYRLRLEKGDAVWDSEHTPTVSISGSYVDAAADHAASLQWLNLQAVASHPAKSGGMDYDYTLPAALPLEAVRVLLPDANTTALFQLQTSATGTDVAHWNELATISAVRVGDKTTAAASFSPQRQQHLRLHTDTPLPQAPALAVAWQPDEFVFLAEGNGPYRLLVGSYAARRGDYPMNDALDRLRQGQSDDWQPALAKLGPRTDLAGVTALEAPKVPYDWTKPLLWAVLVAGALVVAAMALSLLRQSKRDKTQP